MVYVLKWKGHVYVIHFEVESATSVRTWGLSTEGERSRLLRHGV